MKTKEYNPSQIELEFAKIFEEMSDQFSEALSSNKIIKIENHMQKDNPMVIFHLEDTDGDAHEVVLKIIQRPDK
ncbi:MAG: hypothetical protein LAT68_06320 [Cyclobacteriaceae bacterium]|nr:hypothetical protein [Cyclobacteriaceae bacterium]MCH8515925.1 hypothetical protein [Cyclobacteriaceae bacterium]